MKTKFKVIIAVILAVVIGICIQVYHQSEGREHPARDHTGGCCRADHTEDDHLRCIQEHKGNHPAAQQEPVPGTV